MTARIIAGPAGPTFIQDAEIAEIIVLIKGYGVRGMDGKMIKAKFHQKNNAAKWAVENWYEKNPENRAVIDRTLDFS